MEEMTMKIVMVDNHGREDVEDVLIAANVNQNYAQEIAEYLNLGKCDDDDFYFAIKTDDYCTNTEINTLKIISTDNYGREHIADTLIADKVHEQYATKILEVLKTTYETTNGYYDPCFICLKPDDYVLKGGYADLM